MLKYAWHNLPSCHSVFHFCALSIDMFVSNDTSLCVQFDLDRLGSQDKMDNFQTKKNIIVVLKDAATSTRRNHLIRLGVSQKQSCCSAFFEGSIDPVFVLKGMTVYMQQCNARHEPLVKVVSLYASRQWREPRRMNLQPLFKPQS